MFASEEIDLLVCEAKVYVQPIYGSSRLQPKLLEVRPTLELV